MLDALFELFSQLLIVEDLISTLSSILDILIEHHVVIPPNVVDAMLHLYLVEGPLHASAYIDMQSVYVAGDI